MINSFTHKELCEIGARFLKNRCQEKFPVVFVEISTASPETPDVIGFNSMRSALIEVKTSRADFKRDAQKFFRIHPEQGVGNFRYYLCPENLIAPEDVPPKWGLIWVNSRGQTKVVKEILKGNCGCMLDNWFEVNQRSERSILYSGLRRVHD
jgi:hypothetical protein